MSIPYDAARGAQRGRHRPHLGVDGSVQGWERRMKAVGKKMQQAMGEIIQ